MLIVLHPSGELIRYDLGGLLFGSFPCFEDTVELLHALSHPDNRFVVQLPLPNAPDTPYDLHGIVVAGRIQQCLCDKGMPCHVLYEQSPFHTR